MSYSRLVYFMKKVGRRYSNRHIHRVCESEKGQEYASLYSALYHGGIKAMTEVGGTYAPEAFLAEVELMRTGAERFRQAAAESIMDRVGPVKISRQEIDNQRPTTVVINLLPSQISQFLTPPTVLEAETVPLLENPSSNNDE